LITANSMIGILLFTVLLSPQTDRVTPADTSDKPCVVKEVVTEGVRSDCHGWKPAKGEKMYAPAEVNKQLQVGDTFYFVWKQTRWVATPARSTICIVVNLSPVSVVCDEGPQQIEVRDFEWPLEVWGQMHLSGRYNAEIRVAGTARFDTPDQRVPQIETLNLKIIPLPTRDVVDNEALRQQSLKEQRRWRIPPTQVSGKP